MRIHTDGDAEIGIAIKVLKDLQIRAHDQRKGWRRVGAHLKRTVDLQFRTEGVYLNRKKWKPLSPPYLAAKRKAGFTGGILTRTRFMRRSFRTLKITKNRLVFGSLDDKAAWHQHGAGNLPRRRILNANVAVTRDVNKIMKNYLTEFARLT